MDNIKLKEKINKLAKFARKAQEQSGSLRSKIPILPPKVYASISKLYRHDRESLIYMEEELYILLGLLKDL